VVVFVAMNLGPFIDRGEAAGITVSFSPTATLVANGAAQTMVTATVAGDTTFTNTVAFTSTPSGAVSFSAVTNNMNGTYTATVTAGTTAEPVTIDASVTAGPQMGNSGSGSLTLTAGPATSVSAPTLTPNSIVANGSSTSTAKVTVTDAHSNPVSGDAVSFQASPSADVTVGATSPLGGGQYSATITSKTTLGGVSISASDTTAGVNGAGSTLMLTAGAAANVAVALVPTSIAANGASTTQATATVTDGSGHALTGETVTFSPTPVGGVTNNHDGTYTATIKSTTTVGQVTVTATDTGNGAHGSATLTQTVGGPANVSVVLTPPSITANGTSTSTATASVTDANGHALTSQTIAFSSSDSGQHISSVTDAGNGNYTATITSSATVGQATITATDTSVSPNVSGVATLTQTSAGSSTSLVASPSSATTNEQVTLVATVTAGVGAPTGTVAFKAGSAAIGGCASQSMSVSGSVGTATCQTTFAAANSPVALTATFSPTASFAIGGSTGTASLVVSADPTTTTLKLPSGTLKPNQKAAYKATVTARDAGSALPAGTVSFFDHGQAITHCASLKLKQAAGNASATCSGSYSSAGGHSITARYAGDSNFSSSTSTTGKVTVGSGKAQTVATTMRWTFSFAPTYSEVKELMVSRPPAGGAVTVACTGHGCPFVIHRTEIRKSRACSKPKPKAKQHSAARCTPHSPPATLDLAPPFHGRRLVVGTRLVVRVTRPGWIGKYYLFVVHPVGPTVKISCLAPGSTRPGVHCH
jgi:Bacterial Ig-like domain (group 3)/Invasin, domain 3/Bacterial Ig-like domain (group 1)